MDFDGMEIFSASKREERSRLGKTVTEWRERNPALSIVNVRLITSFTACSPRTRIAIFYKK